MLNTTLNPFLMSKIYLAIPYTGIEHRSFETCSKIAHDLIIEGHFVFSPISHSHPIWIAGGRVSGADVWLRQDEEFMKWAEEVRVIVLEKDGIERIQNSKGVQKELGWAREQNKPITFIEL